AEAEAYEKLTKKMDEAARHKLATVQNDEELKMFEDRLEGLAVPEPYEGAWAETPAVRVRNRWRAEAKALRQAIAEEETWFKNQAKRGDQLVDEGSPLVKKSAK